MANLTCPHCKSTNMSKLEDNVNPDRKLFIPTVEIGNDGSHKIISDHGFAFDAYVCNDCKITILLPPNIQSH